MDENLIGLTTDSIDVSCCPDYSTCCTHKIGKCTSHLGVVNDTCLGHEKSGDSSRVRLVLQDFLRTEPAKSLKAVGCTSPLQFLQERQFAFRGRDNKLPASLVRDLMCLAEAEHRVPALDTEAGLQRAWLVVETRMYHPLLCPL